MALNLEKRDYFCSVKRIKDTFNKRFALLFILVFSILGAADAQKTESQEENDSIIVSLLTCAPHDEVYALYGHSALRYCDLKTGEDWAFNYGVFNFNKPYFVLRFTFGLTDYELGVIPYDLFVREYAKTGRQVTQQVLNLTHEEKLKVREALAINYRPENRIYRYNYFYDNCTTRARDIIERCVSGEVIYNDASIPVNGRPDESKGKDTYRKEIHLLTRSHPWAAFGNDLCLGAKADFTIDYRQRQFLPHNLFDDFATATIKDLSGHSRPLVKSTDVEVPSNPKKASDDGFCPTPLQCATAFFFVSMVIVLAERKLKHTFIIWDLSLMLVVGIAGFIVLALFFSEHPTTSTNLQILLLNPALLFFIPSVWREHKSRKAQQASMKGIGAKRSRYWIFSLICLILYSLGAIIQDYAEGMAFLALSLLTRCYIHRYIDAQSCAKKTRQ